MKRNDLTVIKSVLALVPATLLGLAVWTVVALKSVEQAETGLEPLQVDSARQLDQLFNAKGYDWPPAAPVPAVSVSRLPDGMDSLALKQKKQLFFRTLLPLVITENNRIRRQREYLLKQFAHGDLQPGSPYWRRAVAIADSYRVAGDINDPQVRRNLLRRVDVVPAGLVLAQAANESAWGSSRFAMEANNLFGQWTYDPDKGVVPKDRAEGANHFVRAFPDVRSSVRAYLHNINIGHAYVALRWMRQEMRDEGKPLDPVRLAEGLERYSQRGKDYVDEIQAMIVGNDLNRLGQPQLAG